MCTNEKFYADIKKGKVKEEIFKKFYEKSGSQIIDVRDDSYYRKKDVDFLLTDKKIPIDVKSFDRALSFGLIMVETASGRFSNAGWFKTSKSKAFVWVLPCNGVYLILILYRSLIDDYLKAYPQQERTIGNGKGYYIKINSNNRYCKEPSIVEFIKEKGIDKKYYFYCDKEGNVIQDYENKLV